MSDARDKFSILLGADQKHFGLPVTASGVNLNLAVVPNQEMDLVYQWLDDNKLGCSAGSPTLSIEPKAGWTVGTVAIRAIKDLHLKSSPSDIRAWVRDKLKTKPDLWKGVPGVASVPSPKLDLSFSIVPMTTHVDTKTGAVTTDDEQGQISYSGDFSIESDNPAIPKLAWQAAITGSGNDFTITGVTGSVTASWAKSFLQDTLKLEMVLGAGGGLSPTTGAAGCIAMMPQAQVGADGKATYTLPGTGKKVQLVFEMNTTATMTKGSNPTVDMAPTALLQVSF